MSLNYFVLVGLVERWMSYNSTGARASEARNLAGTPTFASDSMLSGNTPGRADDIESMVRL